MTKAEAPRQNREEKVIKEYPHTTRWLEGKRILGSGNLILTTERLVFLNQVVITPKIEERLRELAGALSSRVLDFSLTLHKNNFQIPLSSIVSVKRGRFATLPIPRFCLLVTYREKKMTKTASFMFTISMLQGLFKLEFTVVLAWVWAIEKTMKARGLKI